jgi:hypothetical protein
MGIVEAREELWLLGGQSHLPSAHQFSDGPHGVYNHANHEAEGSFSKQMFERHIKPESEGTMYCDCTSHHAERCVADAYHLPVEQVLQRYLPCLCDCHEDEEGRPVTEQEWDELQAISTRLPRLAPTPVHPFQSASFQAHRHPSP